MTTYTWTGASVTTTSTGAVLDSNAEFTFFVNDNDTTFSIVEYDWPDFGSVSGEFDFNGIEPYSADLEGADFSQTVGISGGAARFSSDPTAELSFYVTFFVPLSSDPTTVVAYLFQLSGPEIDFSSATNTADIFAGATDFTTLEDSDYEFGTLLSLDNLVHLTSTEQDVFVGGDTNDEVSGGLGKDDLSGGKGADTLNGGKGNDTLNGDNGSDTLKGGKGNDTLNGGNGADLLDGGVGDDALDGGNGNDALSGGDGNDLLVGGDGEDTLDGNDGKDVIKGGDGQDQISGGNGNDILRGENGADNIIGGKGKDAIYGGNGGDDIFAGQGDDTIYGGKGNDVLLGEGGDDLFIFKDGFGNDSIQDFDTASTFEKIDLSDVSAITDWADLNAGHLQNNGGTAVIVVSSSNTIFLDGVAVSDLSEDDFIF